MVQEVVYSPSQSLNFKETRALFVGNIQVVEIFDTELFTRILSTQSARCDCTFERAWLNGRLSHCFVLVSGIPGAVLIRNTLNNKTSLPDIDNNGEITVVERETDGIEKKHKNTLFVDHIPVRAIDAWIDQEKSSPADAVWKISYFEKKSIVHRGYFTSVLHEMINYPNDENSNYIRCKLKPYKNDSEDTKIPDGRIAKPVKMGRRKKGKSKISTNESLLDSSVRASPTNGVDSTAANTEGFTDLSASCSLDNSGYSAVRRSSTWPISSSTKTKNASLQPKRGSRRKSRRVDTYIPKYSFDSDGIDSASTSASLLASESESELAREYSRGLQRNREKRKRPSYSMGKSDTYIPIYYDYD